MGIIADGLPYREGELIGLVKGEEDDFYIVIPHKEWENHENTVLFVAKDKKAMDTLAAKLEQVVWYIRHHNEKCDCP